MKILICPDKFKGSLTSQKAAEHIRNGILAVLDNAECTITPIADGGEGTVDAIRAATGGNIEEVFVHDPLMRPVRAAFCITGNGLTAVIEMASASGLVLLKHGERNPMMTTTFGTGELIREVLNKGCSEIIIGIGGSATVDGGVGMAQALGVRFIDDSGMQVASGGGNLGAIRTIDISTIDSRIKNCRITVATDVNNLLTGSEGAARVFGPQKGADDMQVGILDNNLAHLGRLIREQLKIDVEKLEGGGAAGGLGAGIAAFLGGKIRNGFEVISEIVQLERKIMEVDLVITGEGKIDKQTAYGKAPAGVARLALKHNKPIVAFAGTLADGYEELYKQGFNAIIPIVHMPMTLDDSVKNAGVMLEAAAERMARVMKIGKRLP